MARKNVRFRGNLRQDSDRNPTENDARKEDTRDLNIDQYVRLGSSRYRLRRQEDTMWITALEILGLLFVIVLLYTAYYHYDHLHFQVSRGYAHLGYSSAQHVVGQRYLVGKGIEKNETAAMEWFKAAAKQGHPEASFNLAVGHMHGSKTGLRRGESEKLLRFAAENGVEVANHALNLCARRGCD